MHTVAICLAHTAPATRAAIGREPHTAPPLRAANWDPRLTRAANLLYFKLHGQPDSDFWSDERGNPVLFSDQAQAMHLSPSAVVVIANCHMTPASPMLQALQAAQPAAIIYGSGPNYAGITQPGGADLLVIALRRLLPHTPIRAAWKLARLYTIAARDPARADIQRSFTLWTP